MAIRAAACAFVVCLVGFAGSARAADVVPAPPAPAAKVATISYADLVHALERHTIASATVDDATHTAAITYADGARARVRYPASDSTLPLRMVSAGVDVQVAAPPAGSFPFMPFALLAAALLAAGLVVRGSRRSRRPNFVVNAADGRLGGLRPDVKISETTTPDTRFTDVAGCDEAVDELAEIVEFLRTPEKFQRLDAKMPSGLLLTGPPGTGKTMLARALAGEAGVEFFTASGSEFVEKFVGVGASRVRDLFKRAKAHSPAVVFIDEIDAIGASRGNGDGNSEREQTLNELLVQMDGFASSDAVVVIAATNRSDVLDSALLRPGRFSRRVSVGLPSEEGRRAILRVHSSSKPLAADVDLDAIAAMTGSFSGAQLADLLNEAAIMAARDDREAIVQDDLREGLRRVIAGPKRKSAPIADGELEKIAYHEAGHVVCAELCESHEKAQHVTIDPRGEAMGFALFGRQDRALHDEAHLREAMIAALGGRAAEQLVFGRVSSGAKNDLEQVNSIARAAVTEYGMSERLGQLGGDERRLSNETRARVDREVERMVAGAYNDALALLRERRRELDALAQRLLQARELERIDIVSVLAEAA
jgi:cell division protease FtsH